MYIHEEDTHTVWVMCIFSIDMEWMIGKGSNEVDIGESLSFAVCYYAFFLTTSLPPLTLPPSARISTSYGDAFYKAILCDGEWDCVGF